MTIPEQPSWLVTIIVGVLTALLATGVTTVVTKASGSDQRVLDVRLQAMDTRLSEIQKALEGSAKNRESILVLQGRIDTMNVKINAMETGKCLRP